MRAIPGLCARLFVLLAVAVAAPVPAARAQELTGSISMGTRTVEVAGTEEKYREDINLDDGLRLFNVDFAWRPEQSEAPIDEFILTASHLGGDPFESIHVGVRRFGAYRLEIDHHVSEYFYADTILPPALASIPGSTAGDLHEFDFERVRDEATLDIDATPLTRVSLGLERQTRTGTSTTTRAIERDEFELEQPLDESLERLRLGVAHEWQSASLIFEEVLGDYTNTSEIFLPGASPGQNPADPAELQYFFFDQDYDYQSRSHLLRAVADPLERLRLSAFWRREDLKLDLEAEQRSDGTSFNGTPYTLMLSGPGASDRDIEQAGADLGFTLGPRTRLIAGVRSHRLDQDGAAVLGPSQGASRWSMDTDAFELGVELALGDTVTLTAGRSAESRQVDFTTALNAAPVSERHDTDRDGYFAELLYRSQGGLSVTGSIDDNSIDDPFALAAPTDTVRYRVTTRYAWENGVSVQAGRRRTDADNDESGWSALTEQSDLRLAWQRGRFDLAAGVALTELDRGIDQLVTAGTVQRLFPIDYLADLRLRDLSMRWAASQRVTVGATFGSYDNRGSFPLERDDHRLFTELVVTDDHRLRMQYRDVDYAEDAYDAYDADILELAFELVW